MLRLVHLPRRGLVSAESEKHYINTILHQMLICLFPIHKRIGKSKRGGRGERKCKAEGK